MTKSYDRQMKDSDMIFNQITGGSYREWSEVERTVVMLYSPDMTISRSGISHALKRLERHYKADAAEGKI